MVSATMIASVLAAASAPAQDTAVPPGTILPVRLNTSLSSSETRPGQIVSARIMQDVPLSNGGKIREGSKVIGHVVDVTAPTDSGVAKVSLQFDKLISAGRTIPIRTNLRAVAGFMSVLEAALPNCSVYAHGLLSTNHIGGAVAYDPKGPVTAGDNAGVVVGKTVKDGVLDPPASR